MVGSLDIEVEWWEMAFQFLNFDQDKMSLIFGNLGGGLYHKKSIIAMKLWMKGLSEKKTAKRLNQSLCHKEYAAQKYVLLLILLAPKTPDLSRSF